MTAHPAIRRDRIEAARLLREYRDCHALTTDHPAATGFREEWNALTTEERRELVPSGIFPPLDVAHSGPICRAHNGQRPITAMTGPNR